MGKGISLRTRIYIILAALVFITLIGGLIMVWYTYRIEEFMTHIVLKSVTAYQAAEALETSLVNQKGFVSYYFLDGNPDWLRQLGEYRQIFKERLEEARRLAETDRQRQAIHRIESEYTLYITGKDQVIAHYKAGEREAGARLHNEVRDFFFKTLKLCEEYKDLHKKRIELARNESLVQAQRLRIVAGTAILTVIVLGLLLMFILVNHILGPIRRLALETQPGGGSKRSGDEVRDLGRSVRGLIQDIDRTHTELEKSREHLIQAEKMALVGKLAAGVAHSIRNPLTSVKMRLFSLGRNPDLSAHQKEDLEVISEEIGHIDTIVQNFLEFSRPPKLKMQQISPSEVVDLVLQLLRHRLESYDVEVRLDRQKPLPVILADPEQLKEVLVNIVINACEAMEGGGSISIKEEEGHAGSLGRVVIIRLTDSGPGVPKSILDKVFEPFFTTKEEGSGLGLSIAARIVEEHGGAIDLESQEGGGSTFTITLPTGGVHP